MLTEVPFWLRDTPRPYTHPTPPRVLSGPTWDRLLDAAKSTGCSDPQKMAESMMRVREKSLALKAGRHHTSLVPYHTETVPSRPKAQKPTGPKCSATTLVGKPCSYRPVFHGFCAKHCPSDEVLKLARK